MFKPPRSNFLLRGRGHRTVTVCVAAFAAQSSAIVLISDKAVSRGSMAVDTSICKMSQLADQPWFTLISGSISTADEILMLAESKLSEYDGSLLSIMKLTSKAYQEVYDSQLAKAVLAPKLLTNDQVFLRSRKYLPLPDKLTDEINEDRKQFEKGWDSELLICGFDGKQNAHIFRLWNGHAMSEDRIGYSAVGIGADAAVGRLMWIESHRDDELDQILWDSFDAKVQAEVMQGVGYNWDAHIILKSKPNEAFRVPDKIQELMDKAMNYTNCSPFDRTPDVPEDVPPDNWKAQITEFTQGLIPSKLKTDEGQS
jgi:hypothetical protein